MPSLYSLLFSAFLAVATAHPSVDASVDLTAQPDCDHDPGADLGATPAVDVKLNKHFAKPVTGLNMMGVYSTNFNETPYCCPFNPKQFEIDSPPGGWGVLPTICQVADAGQNGKFNSAGTVLVGDSWVFSNGSLAYFGHAGSRNGPYNFGFAATLDLKTVSVSMALCLN